MQKEVLRLWQERLERDLVAFVAPHGEMLTYAQSALLVDRLTEALIELGIGGADRVGFLVPRGPLGAVGFLAISSVAMCCPLNPRMRSDEMARTVETMGITAFVSVASDTGEEEISQTQGFPTLVLQTGPGLGDLSIAKVAPRGESNLAAPPDFALLMQTSGTTSLPKRVELSHGNILAAASAIRDAFTLGESDCCLNPMPLHHVHGLISASLSSLVSGSRVLCTEGFSTKSFEAIRCLPLSASSAQ